MDEAFLQFKAHNESKNIFKAARTPAVFFAIAVTMYILSGIFGLVGLNTFSYACNVTMGVGLLTLALWAYIRLIVIFANLFIFIRLYIQFLLTIRFYCRKIGTAVNSEKLEQK